MNNPKLQIKLAFFKGLKDIVLKEVEKYNGFNISRIKEDMVYSDFVENFDQILNLKSVLKAYVVSGDRYYTPRYLAKHKSVLGKMIEIVINKTEFKFKSFKIICAGSDTPEVRSISEYVQNTFTMVEDEDADLKIHIIKAGNTWEVGVQITPRPLSAREYRERNMRGAMNPTIAYAVNSLAGLDEAESYLNVFSGSATLLIEAGLCYPNLKKLVGFDNDKEILSLAMKNIKKAGLIRNIRLKEKDIFDMPDLGKFDVITSDLPFGMLVLKNEDLHELYRCFVDYCEKTLIPEGILVAYTSEHKLLQKIILKSKFEIIKTVELKLITSDKMYLRPNIFVCK